MDDEVRTFLETPASDAGPRPPDDLTGRVAGSYRIEARIGAGGMGEVFRAHDAKLDRPVALKLLSADVARDPERLKRFRAEARAASSLNHPHILIIHDFGELDARPFIVTELVEGQTLRQKLEAGPIPVREAIEIAAQVSGALSAAHARGIVHRDIKPENIMVRPDGYVKVLDFGLAKLMSPPPPEGDASVLRTQPGIVMGTPRYMSPEQARGHETDPRTDVWSIGVVLYEMVSGRSPFIGSTAADLIAAILGATPAPLDVAAPHAPESLARIAAICLRKDPAGRYATAADLQAALAAATSDAGSRTPKRPATYDSLAVLPFVNASGDPDAEYFSDGITEHIIGSLSTIPTLKVMARSTTFRYKGREVDPMAVGRELRVRAVMTGRLVQRGDRLTISLELVDVDEGSRLWGARYETALADVLSMQDTIATEVSSKLRVELTGADRSRLTRRATDSVEAYHAYLRGRYAWNRRLDTGFRQAIKYFEQANAEDPTYALSYVGLADSYALLGIAEYGAAPPRDVMPKAKSAALKALEIDETLAEAHTSLAHIRGFYEWDWTGAEQEFQRTFELNPRYHFGHHWYALFLAAMRRPEEAIASELRALEIEPLSLVINKNVGTIYYYARQFEPAFDYYRRVLDLDPGFARTRFFLGMAYEANGQPDEAVEEYRKGLTLSGGSSVVHCMLARGLAAAGRHAEARDMLAELTQRSRTHYVPAFSLALAHQALGDVESTFDYLNRAFDERSSWLVSLNIEPLLDPIRDDPRFADLVRRVGLP